MKKFAIILLVVFFSSISLAHIGHYNKFDKIEMEILRNDKVIGYNNYFFKRDGEKTIVKNQYKFEVKVLSATIFKVEGYGKEIYIKDNLISFQSKTLQNKKEKFVNLKLDKNNKKFDIKGSSYSGEASIKNIIGNWWSHRILQAESQISPISGSIKEQIVTFIGKENISINGKQYETDHFKLTSKDMTLPEDKKLNFDIWLHKKTSVIVKVKYKRMGDWEYRLKNLE
ncbi:DUF6134 family protein [Candidatus Pelagibacter ubique]|uniref:DUF6134 family protein n=1 Tax=Pelagibacter ubique TaxID=198252 RepID=UPI0003D1B710